MVEETEPHRGDVSPCKDTSDEVVRDEPETPSKQSTDAAPLVPPSTRKLRQRRTKEQLKEELREKKVLEKKKELSRQRTLNQKYMSEDFTSIFSEKKDLLSGGVYVEEEVVETVIVGESLELDASGNIVSYSETVPAQESFASKFPEEIIIPDDDVVYIVSDTDSEEERVHSSRDYSHRDRRSSRSRHKSRSRRKRRRPESNPSLASSSRPVSPYSEISDTSSICSVKSIEIKTSEVATKSSRRHHEGESSGHHHSSRRHKSSHCSDSPAAGDGRRKSRYDC